MGATPSKKMYKAVKSRKMDDVKKYLNDGADPNYKPKRGEPALVIAVAKGYEGITAILLEANSNANQSDKDDTRVLTIAIHKGFGPIVEKLVEAKADLNYRDKEGCTPLLHAAQKGYCDIMSILINAQADIHAVNSEGKSALHYSALWRNESLTTLLLNSKADVSLADKDGITPLHLAAFRGSKEVIEVLVKHGANIDAVTNDGCTPLCVSIEEKMDIAACELVKLKANIDIKPMVKLSCLNYLNSTKEMSLLQAAISNELEDTAKELKLVMNENLIQAALENNSSLVQKLLNDGADPNALDKSNTPLLHLVLTNTEMLKLLITQDSINVNAVNTDKETSLHAAACKGLQDAVVVLLPHSDLTLYIDKGETPLVVAIKRGFRDIASAIYNASFQKHERVGEEMVTLGSQLGSGGFGAVYNGKFKGQEVAIKVQFKPASKSKDELQRELQREVNNMTRIHSPYIMQLIAIAGENTGKTMLVLPLMNGNSLRTYLNSKLDERNQPTQPLNFTKLEIAWVIANAILDLHNANVVHRDLKSLNVLLCSKNYIKVSDLGSANDCQSGMTTGVGTHEWMAPEVFETGSDYTLAADIYSFGVILTELDTCIEPYANFVKPPPSYKDHPKFKELGESPTMTKDEIVRRIRKDGLRPVLRQDCEDWYKDLVKRCLAHDPSERPTAQQIVDVLLEHVQKQDLA